MAQMPAAVYVTTPDYLGNCLDVGDLARVCRQYDVPLLVDNAHGAYLKFLPEDCHPITLGADLCCDSAHKTLPVLTGGAYLHIGKNAPDLFQEQTEKAMALFASTSPSYLILQSLDRVNRYLADGYRDDLSAMIRQLGQMKEKLSAQGFEIVGNEPGKLTIAPKSYGYTGDELHDLLRSRGMECEFSDPDFVVLMATPENEPSDFARLKTAFDTIEPRERIKSELPVLQAADLVLNLRQAVLSPSEKVSLDDAIGRICAAPTVACPPAVPIVISGERITSAHLEVMRYYGYESIEVVK
jgi:arginine/lysine/ornithine decarboxylase